MIVKSTKEKLMADVCARKDSKISVGYASLLPHWPVNMGQFMILVDSYVYVLYRISGYTVDVG